MTQERESRLAGNEAAADLGGNQIDSHQSSAAHPQPAGSTYARRAWARALIDRAGGQSIPRYGSVEWIQLPEAHPVKIAAVVVAAEAWATDADTLPDRLKAEVDTLARAHKRAEDADYRQRMDDHRAEWQHLSRRVPTGQRGDASVPLEEVGRRYRLQVIRGGGGAA